MTAPTSSLRERLLDRARLLGRRCEKSTGDQHSCRSWYRWQPEHWCLPCVAYEFVDPMEVAPADPPAADPQDAQITALREALTAIAACDEYNCECSDYAKRALSAGVASEPTQTET